MSRQDLDVAASQPGYSVSDPSPVPGLGHAASVPNAEYVRGLIAECERAGGPDRQLDCMIAACLPGATHGERYTGSIDAAVTLVPPPGIWRKYTDDSCSVYAASPFNAAAQVLYDGNAATVPLQICAAALAKFERFLAKAEARASAALGKDS